MGIESQVANDFILSEPTVITRVRWWGVYTYEVYPPDLGLPFNFKLYATSSTPEKPAVLLEEWTSSDYLITSYPEFEGSGWPAYEFEDAGLEIPVEAGIRYWLVIQHSEHNHQQWFRLNATGFQGIQAHWRAAYFGAPEWTPLWINQPVVPAESSVELFAEPADPQIPAWSDDPDIDINGYAMVSAVISELDFESEVANDFMVAQSDVITRIRWWGGPRFPSSLVIRLYESEPGSEEPDYLVDEWTATGVEEWFLTGWGGGGIFQYDEDGLAIPVSPGIRYWVSVQAADHHPVEVFWSRVQALAVQGAETRFKSAYWGYPEWTATSVPLGYPWEASVAVYLESGTTAVPEQGPNVGQRRSMLSTAFPNPTRDGANWWLSAPRSTSETIDIFDASGSLVRSQQVPPSATADTKFQWDGTRRNGERASAGVYWARVRGRGGAAQPVVVVR